MADNVTHERYSNPGLDLSPFLTGRTQLVKTTLSQEVRVVVPPLPRDARVTVMTPASPVVYMALDEDPHGPNGPGYNRVYKMPIVPDGVVVGFTLVEGQWIIMACNEGTADVSIILEPVR